MKNTTIFLMILGAALSRLIPHVPNVTAVTAMALFGGVYFSNRSLALLAPLAAMLISDLVIGFHSTMPFVYGAMLVITLLSFWGLRKGTSLSRLGMASLSSSLIFFFISNFGVWWMDGFYEKSAKGLLQCYTMALPFLGTQMVGDLLYTGLLFGTFEVLRRMTPVLAQK